MEKIISFFLIFITFVYIKSFTLAIEGCFCGPNSLCYPDGCTRRPINSSGAVDHNLCKSGGCHGAYECCYDTNSVEANRYFCLEQPPCCEEMVKRNNAEACCWPERGYCHPEYCKQISDPKGCAWYWRWHDNIPDWMARPYGYGCVRGTSPENLEPVFGLPKIAQSSSSPTPTPLRPTPTDRSFSISPSPTRQPTIVPTFSPTPSPTPFLTEMIYPTITSNSINQPTQSILPTLIPTSFRINLEEIPLKLAETIKNNFSQVSKVAKDNAKKISQPTKKVFYEIKRLDQNLEDYINEKIINYFLKLIIKTIFNDATNQRYLKNF